MASRIVIDTGVFPSADNLRFYLRLLTEINVRQQRAGSYPKLLGSGIRYRREARDRDGIRLEEWRATATLYRLGFGDCEDLASTLAAEYQVRGVRALAIPVRAGRGWHIVVQLPNGRRVDPSAKLGMGGG